MTNRVEILGIRLDNYTVREAVRKVDGYLSDHAMNTIEHISMQMLIASESDPVLKEVLSTLDLAVIGEKEILQAAGIGTMQRLRETEENDFSYEFFRKAERGRKILFLLGETEEKLIDAREALLRDFPQLAVAGGYALEHCKGDFEAAINEMNATTPDIIVSLLPSPMQEHFFWEHKGKISTGIWYGTGGAGFERRRLSVWNFFRNVLHLGRLKSSMVRYRKKEELPEEREEGGKDEE